MRIERVRVAGHDARTFVLHDRDDGDRAVLNAVFREHCFALPLEQAVRMPECTAPLVLDLGAHIGAASVYYAQALPEALVVAVEPEAENFRLLQLNTRGLKVDALWAAVGPRPGLGSVVDPGRGAWGYRVEPVTKGDGRDVPILTVDQVLERHPNRQPYLLKIDIEGGEAELFDDYVDASRTWLHHFPVVVIELHDWMLPGRGASRGFLRALTHWPWPTWDVLVQGETLMCFNNARMREAE